MRHVISILALLSITSVCFAENVTLTSKQTYTAKGTGVCGLVKKKWKPVKKIAGSKYKVIAGSQSLKTLCKSLLVPKKLSITKLPDASKLVASGASQNSLGIRSVSGTPPTLSEIATNGASNTFWRSGVVSAITDETASGEQCGEFFGSNTDGQSAGFAGCYMAQETGYVMGNIIQSGNTLCYMKNFPTQAVQDAGGFTVESGSLPSGGITQIFTPPSGDSPRFVKINIASDQGTQTGILKIYSQGQNAANGDQYRYDMIFCSEGQSTPREYEKTKVTLSGEFVAKLSSSFGDDQERSGQSEGTVRAFLTEVNGEIVFNPDLKRSALFSGVQGPFKYKSSMTLSNDEITNKMYSVENSGSRKGYAVSHIDGTSAGSLRFLEGAYKEQNTNWGNFSTAVEYRDSVYLAAPDSPYAARLGEVDLDTDSFFSSEPSIAGGSAPISCNQRVSVTLALDMQSEVMQGIRSQCEGERLDGMNFCNDDSLQNAQSHYVNTCFPG